MNRALLSALVLGIVWASHAATPVCSSKCTADSDCNDPLGNCNKCRKGFCAPVFKCPALPKFPKATDVRHLRPQDIQVVAAVGDSITAGFAMMSGPALHDPSFLEFRGDVFSAGVNADGEGGETLTIPNFLRTYNPDLQGGSNGSTLPLEVIYWRDHRLAPFDPPITHLNGAQSGAVIDDVPDQVAYIVKQLNTTYRGKVDFENDWKLFTIFIGANNLCDACKNRTSSTPAYYGDKLRSILQQIHDNLPRTFVNLIPMFNISQVWDNHQTSTYCRDMWDTFAHSECGCLTDPKTTTPEGRQMMDVAARGYNAQMYSLANEWDSKNLQNFTVRVQPSLEGMQINDINFVSQLDCFHPSGVANGGLAVGVWNNMMTEPAKKSHIIDVANMTVLCPTADTYLN